MRIIGVDPGTIRTGYGIIETDGKSVHPVGFGLIRLNNLEVIPERLEVIYEKLAAAIDQFKPECMAIETAFYGKNVQSALKIGLARGAAMLVGRHRGLVISEYAPREIKKAVTGNGAASKEQVSGMVISLLSLRHDSIRFDETDALAAAICHAFRNQSFTSKNKSWKTFIEQNPERIVR